MAVGKTVLLVGLLLFSTASTSGGTFAPELEELLHRLVERAEEDSRKMEEAYRLALEVYNRVAVLEERMAGKHHKNQHKYQHKPQQHQHKQQHQQKDKGENNQNYKFEL